MNSIIVLQTRWFSSYMELLVCGTPAMPLAGVVDEMPCCLATVWP